MSSLARLDLVLVGWRGDFRLACKEGLSQLLLLIEEKDCWKAGVFEFSDPTETLRLFEALCCLIGEFWKEMCWEDALVWGNGFETTGV